MSKGRKQAVLWQAFLQGSLSALGLYLLGLLLLALVLVRGGLPESAAFQAVAVLCAASALAGGLVTVWRSAWRAAGPLTGGIFALFLALAGLGLWKEAAWLGRGGILLLCALGGGLLSGLLFRRRRKARRK